MQESSQQQNFKFQFRLCRTHMLFYQTLTYNHTQFRQNAGKLPLPESQQKFPLRAPTS